MKLPIAKPIDKLLNGGIESGCITNFYGPSASGKTQIATKASVSCIRNGKKVVYIDTEGGFSLERLKQLVGDDIRRYTDNIILIEPKSWEEQKMAIKNLSMINDDKIGLIIVDSLVAFWRFEITDENAQSINRELASQLSILSKIAREKKIPVLITNQVYDDISTGKTEMSGRNLVKWWSKNIIELKHSGKTGIRIAEIIRARSIPEGKRILFKISTNDLEEVEI